MKPYGKIFSRDGCTCSLCRSRGYRKSRAYDRQLRTDKTHARQLAKAEIRKEIADA